MYYAEIKENGELGEIKETSCKASPQDDDVEYWENQEIEITLPPSLLTFKIPDGKYMLFEGYNITDKYTQEEIKAFTEGVKPLPKK